jgi:hypothetical protein
MLSAFFGCGISNNKTNTDIIYYSLGSVRYVSSHGVIVSSIAVKGLNQIHLMSLHPRFPSQQKYMIMIKRVHVTVMQMSDYLKRMSQ